MSKRTFLHQKLNRAFMWLKRRIVTTLQKDTPFWRLMCAGLWLAMNAAVVTAGLGNPTGLGLFADLVLYFLLSSMIFLLASILAAFLLSLLYLPVPRWFVGSLLTTGMTVYYVLYLDKLGILFSVIIAGFYSVIASVFALNLAILIRKEFSLKLKSVVVLLTIACGGAFLFWPFTDKTVSPSFSEDESISGGEILHVENPAESGRHSYRYFTYGSGQDKHRREFGADADLLSTSVDASAYIDEWPQARYRFWGFDEHELPLNGRVWMPDGEGPFPLVLITHGNHRMEYFSDAGYGYLGELLASRGFITVSIDQNFLNYTSWSGIPKEDRKLRAWMFWQHLLEIQKFQDRPGTPFYNKVDLQHTALIGHSRGGQAAAMAADHETWFSSDTSLAGMEDISIQAVVGLAPTDRKVDDTWAHLQDVYYLVLHGARDADVTNFRGDRQYVRSAYSKGSERFKASLYIAEANHSQFNTDWGSMDISLPGGLFLNRSQTMEPAAQREVTKVYVSAFLETALRGNTQYINLFRAPRYGRDWLPNTQYVSRFESGKFIPLDDFEGNRDGQDHQSTSAQKSLTAEAKGFTEWRIRAAQDRSGKEKNTQGVLLEWNSGGVYTLHVRDSLRERLLTDKPDSLLFSMANMGKILPQVDVEIESAGENIVRLPLNDFMLVSPRVETQYTHLPWFDQIMKKGKYSKATEPVFQTYLLPLSAFEQINADFQVEEITKISLYFSDGPGKVMLDDIGFGGIS